MEHYFVFNNKRSCDYGVWISGGGTFNAPARETEEIVIPGRNGVLTYDNGRYDAADVIYPAFISRRFVERVDAFRAFLTSSVGLHRLEDTYHPEEYRLARFSGGFAVTPAVRNLAGTFEIAFRCQPERFLKDGEIPVHLEADGTLFNYTLFPAKPLITVYGTDGSITVGGVTMTLSDLPGVAVIDCGAMEAPGLNDHATLDDGAFPVLSPGLNDVVFTGFSSVSIVPRWYTL